jgi:hypothetical protein
MITAMLPVAAFVINVFVQVVSYRSVSSLNFLRAVFVGFGAGLMAIVAFSVYDYAIHRQPPLEFLSIFIMNLITYSALGYCYFHFINLGTTARRIRLLIEISEVGCGLSYEEILERYNSRKMVDMRLHRLLDTGQVVLRDGRCFIGKPALLLIARAIIVLKLLVLGKRR